jgi:hypothetical protein
MTHGTTKPFAAVCPFCAGDLELAKLVCTGCGTQIDTRQPIPAFHRLPADLQEFVIVFLRCRGNIREAEKELGISYPTVCKKLDLVNSYLSGRQLPPVSPREVLERVERGELSAAEAAKILRGESL